MKDFDILSTLLLIIVAVFIIFLVLQNRLLTNMKKIYFLLAFLGLLIYSGISTLYIGLCQEFYFSFLLYAIFFSLSFIWASYFKTKRYGVNYSDSQLDFRDHSFAPILDTSYLSDRFLGIMTFLNFLYLIVQLVYPVNRLKNLFTFNVGAVDFFLQREVGRALPLYQLFYYIELSTTVFFYIYILRLIKKNKLPIALLIIVLKMYISFAVEQYIGRSGIVANLLFLVLVVIYARKQRYLLKDSIKIFVVLGIAFIFAMPAMYAYEFIRLGLSFNNISNSTAIQTLFWQETNYGTYYSTLVNLHSGKSLTNWLLWLFTLPLPSFIFSFKSNLLLVNQALSEFITGVPYGHMYYSVKLPSLFGESLYVFGPMLFWLHAIIMGTFLNKFCGMLEKSSELEVLNIYFATKCLLIGRGGSSSILPEAINTTVFFAIIMLIMHRLKTQKQHRKILVMKYKGDNNG